MPDIPNPSQKPAPGGPVGARSERARLEHEIARLSGHLEQLEARCEVAVSTQLRLAGLLRDLAEHDASGEPLERAVELYRASLEGTSPDDGNSIWRETNAQLGAAFLELHRVSSDVEPARRAVRPLQNALPLYDPGTRQHRVLSRRVGAALLAVGQAERDANALRQAVSAYRAGLASDTDLDLDDPGERAVAVRELARALRVLGVVASEEDRLEEAFGLIDEALGWIGDAEPFTRTLLVAEARRVRDALGRSEPRSAAVRDALRAYAAGDGQGAWVSTPESN